MTDWQLVIAAQQQRNALDAAAYAQQVTANAQIALANETARHNQIVQQVENERNELLQRQLDEQRKADQQERFAKGLLVQAEFDIQSADVSEMEFDDLSAHIGNLNSLIDFADNNRLLSDFFLNVDDIRFAQKTIRDVKSHLELANGFFRKARQER